MIKRGFGFLKANMDASRSTLFQTGKKIKGDWATGSEAQRDIDLLKLSDKDRATAIAEQKLALQDSMNSMVKANPNADTTSLMNRQTRLTDLEGKTGNNLTTEVNRLQGIVDKSNRDVWNGMKKAPGQGLDFMMAKDKIGSSDRFKTGAIRTGVGVGAYMGVMGGARYMSGGGMTYDNQGQRDIAGVPFL